MARGEPHTDAWNTNSKAVDAIAEVVQASRFAAPNAAPLKIKRRTFPANSLIKLVGAE